MDTSGVVLTFTFVGVSTMLRVDLHAYMHMYETPSYTLIALAGCALDGEDCISHNACCSKVCDLEVGTCTTGSIYRPGNSFFCISLRQVSCLSFVLATGALAVQTISS